MNLRAKIKLDLYRYAGKTDKKTFLKCFFILYPGFRYIVYFRIINSLPKYNIINLICKRIYNRLSWKYGYQIPKGVKIGKGFLIMHFGHIVINGRAIIGDNCNIYHGVTIGASFKGKNKGYPIIGNEVWIGAGAVIIGGITIGDNVLIAPNSYVNFSVPANSVVLGNPGKIIPKETATEDYIINKV